MKKTNKILSLVLVFAIMTLSFSACGKKDQPLANVDAEIWTMASTEKVLRDKSYNSYYQENVKLNISLAKNEFESAQLIVTPKENVAYFNLSVTNLTSASGEQIKKENISLYAQHYVEVKTRTAPSSTREVGFYPDALIPINVIVESKENTINANQNQGFYMTVKTEKSTSAGNYNGSLTLTINEKIHNVPVSVKVWNFAVPDENHARSTFNLFQEYTMGGQLSNTKENYQKYVDYMLDYRITTTDMVTLLYEGEDWIERMKKYAKDPRVTSYNVHGDGTYGMTMLKALIENSTPELNLVEKAFFYLLDEPFGALEQATIKHNDKIDELIALADSYSSQDLEKYGLTREDIEGVEVLITMTASIGTIDGLRTYAPLVSDFNTEEQRKQYKDFAANPYTGKNNELAGTDYGTTWWYVCVHPYEPYPNYNIDMDLNSNRVLNWMQYEYDIDGLLYWGTATYAQTTSMIDTVNGWISGDVYDKTNGVYAGANGDGYLVYPGAKYGNDDIYPSLRLMAIRDGFEDYEYLYLLEEKFNEAKSEFGISDMSFDQTMKSIYASMYSGTIANTDAEAVLLAREQVAQMIELIMSPSKAICKVGEIDATTAGTEITLIAKTGSKLIIDGKEINGETIGNYTKFVYKLLLTNDKNYFTATLTTGNGELKINNFISNKVTAIASFENSEDIQKVKVSQKISAPKDHITKQINTDLQYVKTGSKSLKIDIQAPLWTTVEQAKYRPYFSIDKEYFGEADRIKSFEIDIYNNSESVQNLTVELQAKTTGGSIKNKKLLNATLSQGWNKIKIDGFSNKPWLDKDENLYNYVQAVNFYLSLPENDVELYVDNMFIVNEG